MSAQVQSGFSEPKSPVLPFPPESVAAADDHFARGDRFSHLGSSGKFEMAREGATGIRNAQAWGRGSDGGAQEAAAAL